MNTNTIEPIRQFREAVYQTIEPSRDAAFEVIDAIAASRDARSAVEVSLSPTMERTFSSVYGAVRRLRIETEELRKILVKQAEASGTLEYDGWVLYALDHTPYPRRAAKTVSDLGLVHGADGVEVGHQYSLLGRVMHAKGSWVGVVDVERIATYQTPTKVAAAQIDRLKLQAILKRIIAMDSEYVTGEILDTADEVTRLLIRFRGNRCLYDLPDLKPEGSPGAPPKHGDKMRLNQPDTLRTPDQYFRIEGEGGTWIVISVWEQVHVTSRPNLALCAIRVEVFTAAGTPRYSRPLWLAWTGPADLDWASFWHVYLKRFCLECVHQFTKNSLAWTRARFASTGREHRWTWLVMLAYWQLLLVAPLARDLLRPWEKPLPPDTLPSPGRVQRDYPRLFFDFGTPARSPKPRGTPSGRPPGFHPAPRPRFRVLRKSQPALSASP